MINWGFGFFEGFFVVFFLGGGGFNNLLMCIHFEDLLYFKE